jgi:two-component system chemotaxis response regulator CheY
MPFDLKRPILVVDDDPMMLDLVKRFLTRLGFGSVDVVGTVDAAETMVRRGSYQLVISDLFLEPGGGLELLRSMRSDERTKAVRFLLMTGSVGASVAAMLVGADGYIMKPFTEAELDKKLESIARRVEHAPTI